MSSETTSQVRSNFASRMLNKVMNERTKTGETAKLTTADASKYATQSETKETVSATRT